MNLSFSKLRRAAVLTLLALSAAAPASAAAPPVPPWTSELDRQHPLAGTIWFPTERRAATPEQLIAAMAAADYVLLGERHDNADHHALQAWLVRALIAEGRRPAVAFEMFGTEQATAIFRYLTRNPRDAAGLGDATGWGKSGWPDWALYRPIAQAALDGGLPVVAANLPADEARAMIRKQPISPERLSELALDQPMPAELHAALAEDIRRGHCDMLPASAISPMVMAQRAKDGSMAAVMVKAAAARGTDGAVLIAGNGHTRDDRGVPLAIRWLQPDARIFSVGLIEVDPGNRDPAAYGGSGGLSYDAVWFTARAKGGGDPCAELAKRMERGSGENKR